MNFSKLNLSAPLMAALPASRHTATKIQQLAIPAVLSGQDVLAFAQTGSGKTLAYGLPLLQRIEVNTLEIQSVVIVPTRELAQQVSQELSAVASKMGISLCTLCGGVAQEEQLAQLAKLPHLIVATPGRLLDLLTQQLISLESMHSVVLDEADRLLEMGFWPDVQRLLSFMPQTKQTLLFSATLAADLEQVALAVLNNPVKIEANQANQVVEEIEEQLYLVNKGSKAQALIALIKQRAGQQVLVFISARDSADAVDEKITQSGYSCGGFAW